MTDAAPLMTVEGSYTDNRGVVRWWDGLTKCCADADGATEPCIGLCCGDSCGDED